MKKIILALALFVFTISSMFGLTYTLSLVDSYGDGWNGGAIDVLVNGSGVINGATIASGSSYNETFEVEELDVITTVYTAGSWSTENEYQILNELNAVVAESGQGGGTPGNIEYTVPEVIAGAPDLALMVSPADGANNVATSGNLEWTIGENTDRINLILADNAEYTTPIIDDIITDVTTTQQAYSGLEMNTVYYWKLVAINTSAALQIENEGTFTTTIFSEDQVVLSGDYLTNTGLPIEPYYGYSLTQSIYLQSELNIVDQTITEINYVFNQNSSFTDNVVIYMGHTDSTAFNATSDWFNDGLTEVFNGDMVVSADNPLVTLELDMPFIYNNVDNLVVCIFETTSGYHSSSDEFYAFSIEDNRSLHYHADGTNPYALGFGNFPTGTLKSQLPVTAFTLGEIPTIPEPVINTEALAFDTHVINSQSDSQVVSLTNIGGGLIEVGTVEITGTDATQFSFTDNAVTSIGPGFSYIANVVYEPTTVGSHSATLVINHDQGDAYNIALTGDALDPTIYTLESNYTQGFEVADEFLGWETEVTSTGDAYGVRNEGTSQSGDFSYKAYSHSDSGSLVRLITPTIVPELDPYRIRFWAKGDGYIRLGRLNTSDELTELDSLELTSTFAEYAVNMDPTRSNDKIVFDINFDGTYDNVYLDDILIEEVPEGSQISFVPDSVDCGLYLQNEVVADSVLVTITNTGAAAGKITEVSVANTNLFEVVYEASVLDTLDVDESIQVYVKAKTDYIGVHESTLNVKEVDPNAIGLPIPTTHTIPITCEVLDDIGDTHNDPFVLTYADSIYAEGTTTIYNSDYDFTTSQDVVYKLTLETDKLMTISLLDSPFDTKLWVFNSFDQIDTATQNADAWYYNDDESSAGTGGRFVEGPKTRDRFTWSKMNQSLALAGDYYIVVSGYSTNAGEYYLHVMFDDIPAPMQATNPTPEDDAIDQATSLTLEWDNAEYTTSNDIYFGTVGNMTLVQENIAVTEEYLAENLQVDTEYEWKVVCKNLSGQTPADSVATWSFTTIGVAPDAVQYLSPDSLGTDVSLSGSLTWEAAIGSDGYHVYLSTDETFTDVVPEDVTTNSYAYSALDYSTRYFWKILPFNAVGSPTEGVETWQFETLANPFPAADLVFDGDRGTYPALPIDAGQNYYVSQSIYYQTELDIDNHSITDISYLYNNNSAWTDNVVVYMGHTNKETFSDSYDWVISNLVKVYDGQLETTTDAPIVNLVLDTPFIYNNVDNLVVCVFETSSGSHSYSDDFYTYPVEGNRSIYDSDYSNAQDQTWATVPYGTTTAYMPVSGFNFQEVPVDPVCSINADTLTFVDQIMGTVSDPQIINISNLGLGDLVITDVALTGTNATEFDLTDENVYSVTLETANTMSVTVAYSPETEGDHVATIEITDSNDTVYTVELVGNSIDTNIYAEDLPYLNSAEEDNDLLGWYSRVETSSDYAYLTIYDSETNANTGSKSIRFYDSGDQDADMMLISPVIVPDFNGNRAKFWMKGDTAGQLIFALYDASMDVLTAIDTIDVPLTYTQFIYEFDTSMTNKRLVFRPIFGGTYDNVYLDDVAFEAIPEEPIGEVTETELAFGEVNVDETSIAQSFNFSNVGAGELIVSNVEISGTDAGMFTFDGITLPDTLLANEMVELNVTFSPTSAGDKTATLTITDNTQIGTYTVALTGNGFVPPTGSVCNDPLALTLPAVDVTGNTGDYGDDYSSTMISPSSSYLNGDDVVYQFTVDTDVTLDGTIVTTGSWMGAFILADEPNATTPVAVEIQKTTSGTSLTYSAEALPAGTYFLIISTYPTPQAIDYTINLTATPVLVEPDTPVDFAIADSETGMVLTWTAVEGATTYKVYGCATPDGTYEMMTGGQVETATFTYTEDAPMMFFKVYASTDEMPLGKTIRRARRN